ncbi:unnamed protein product [Fusarium venenatum]|uniref:Uncharacterized protein n=1 Tax=Fusarium venenatum TaxID=56646 RepID=A0A2L2TAD5_9HYPO|nr:uncharacterized protein FVRRES_03351 [Fusarium venenatum]CEI66839.1 unnamed protein product [Fusarium venenatum]
MLKDNLNICQVDNNCYTVTNHLIENQVDIDTLG